MKKVFASAGMVALGAIGVHSAPADLGASADKPWSISATLRGFYDDNINTQPDVNNLRRSSYGIEIRPRADVNWNSGPTTITASYIYDDRYYASRQGGKNDQSHDVELFVNHNFSERYSIDLEESFVDSQEPEVIDRALSLPLRANGDNLRNNAALNFHAELTPLLGLVLGYANTWYDYSNQTNALIGGPSYATLLNRFEHLVTLNSRWHVAPQTVAILGYQFEAVDYTSSGLIAPGTPANSRNNYTHNIYVGAEHSFRSDLQVSARVGVQVADYYNAPPGNNAGSLSPFVDLSAAYAYMDGGTLTVGFRNSKNQTDVAGFASGQVTQDQESSSVYGTISQQLTPLSPKLIDSLTAQYQNSTFNGGGANNQHDVFYLLGLNLTYQFNRYFSAEVGYNYDRLHSDLALRGYDRNRVYVGVTGSY